MWGHGETHPTPVQVPTPTVGVRDNFGDNVSSPPLKDEADLGEDQANRVPESAWEESERLEEDAQWCVDPRPADRAVRVFDGNFRSSSVPLASHACSLEALACL
jgi:hypothetical protein